jgi:hypothetical protein
VARMAQPSSVVRRQLGRGATAGQHTPPTPAETIALSDS